VAFLATVFAGLAEGFVGIAVLVIVVMALLRGDDPGVRRY
jgi:uncharacterized membrane protein YfcA